ncbi:hypothetical protein [Lapidilactobacillus salsurivasis]
MRKKLGRRTRLAALPLRTRLSFELRGFCEAQSDAHSELTPNFAAQAAVNINTGKYVPCQRRKSFPSYFQNFACTPRAFMIDLIR